MLRFGTVRNSDLSKTADMLRSHFNNYIKSNASVPGPFLEKVYPPDTFLARDYYLTFPFIFHNAFEINDQKFVKDLCISGYLYFKYLIGIDTLLDKDVTSGHESDVPEHLLLLRTHVYNDESKKILARLFGDNKLFWKFWAQRNKEFLSSILLDKEYDPAISLEKYSLLSVGKCSFLKVSVDAYYAKRSDLRAMHKAITKSFDLFSIARCMQDDFEDFKKDVVHRKNNFAHSLLIDWMKSQEKDFFSFSAVELEKYFYISETAEKLLSICKDYFNGALHEIKGYESLLPEYTKYIEAFRNKCNLIKVNIEAYRVSKYVNGIVSGKIIRNKDVETSVGMAGQYIAKMQHSSGSWFEITNKQGLSNVWSTAFITAHIDQQSREFQTACSFLMTNKQNGLWGYNTEWVYDFDSTTSSLLVLDKAGHNIRPFVDKWLLGQNLNGGFSTYSASDNGLISYLGVSNPRLLKGWTSSHNCVSALAYYFLTQYSQKHLLTDQIDALRNYLYKGSKRGVWQSYWWSSPIYSTSFIIRGMLMDDHPEAKERARKSVRSLLLLQNKDGSFSCDVQHKKSVFYTSLVLDMLCHDKMIFTEFRREALAMKKWLLTRQYEDGAFEGSNFLVIPELNVSGSKSSGGLKINAAGGTNTLTGEIANLFSTASSYKALRSLQQVV